MEKNGIDWTEMINTLDAYVDGLTMSAKKHDKEANEMIQKAKEMYSRADAYRKQATVLREMNGDIVDDSTE